VNPHEYDAMFAVEDRHWWYVGVRREVEAWLERLRAERTGPPRILDAGSGTGGLLANLRSEGWKVGIEISPDAVRLARTRGTRLVRGSVSALPFADASFDAVVVCLVFEHLVDLAPPIAEIARVLVPGGRFLFFLNHPLLQSPNSGWVIDHILDEQYWRVGPYLPVDVTMEQLDRGVVLPFVHRPLSQYVNAMADHGLLIEHMEEPAPPPGFIAKADEYRDAVTIPRLLFLRSRRSP
jgi:SAM-dependent methyltransferase